MIRITRSIVPNFLTLANLFSGFIAIVYIEKEMYLFAGGFVLLAAIFDFLDGITARLTKSASEFGLELDSLSDIVSFGVAPSFMLYKIYFYQFADFGILLSALPLMCGVLRLARYNVTSSIFEDKKYFTGMAIPASAFFILSYLIFYHLSNIIPESTKSVLIVLVTISSSIAMISNAKFQNAPRPTKKYIKEHPITTTIFLAVIVVSIVSQGLVLFPFFAFYLLFSFVRHYYLKIWKILKRGDVG
ncbi:MAG: CDP-diacylglycerol--serine O-phosphatidyltransferase [Ignavibacteria bacterium]|nr:CDP-diacylglycerol--serine O-phosphatidyltransferase [Ignavibacteria bacterium]